MSSKLQGSLRDPLFNVENSEHLPMRPGGRFGGPALREADRAWVAWSHGRSITELSDDDFTVLQDVKLKPARDPHNLAHEQAVKFVMDSCNKYKKLNPPFRQTIRSERRLFALFNDMDAVFFGGILKGNVLLKVNENLPGGQSGFTTRAGQTPRIVVELAGHIACLPPGRSLLSALLHQMIHAYLLQCCSKEKPVENPNSSPLRHGSTFSTICFIIQRAFKGIFISVAPPSTMGISTSISDGPPRPPPFHPIGEFELSQLYGMGEDSSHCERDLCMVPWTTCDMCYKQILKNSEVPKIDLEAKAPRDNTRTPRPITQYVHNFSNGRYTPILRSKYASVVPFVEVHFKDRAVPIPQVNAQRSIMAKKSGSAIKLSTTSDTEFEVLFDFLMTGRYGAVLTVTGLGPPIILAQAGSLIVEPAPLVADVQAYRVATEAEVPEMQEFALRRMYSYDTIREDVVAVLDYIYHGAPPSKDDDKKKKKVEPKEPDSRLRQFVRMWLVRDHDAYKTNLGALRRNPVLMEKFSVLRAKGGLLITDVDYVDRQIDSAIEQATRVAMPPYVVAQQGGPLALQQAHVQAPVQARLEGAVVPHHGADWRQGSEAVFRIDGRASWPW